MQNTKIGLDSTEGDIATLSQSANVDANAEQIAALESKLATERNDRLEERFIWIIVVIIAVDLFGFMRMSTLSAPIVVGAIQAILIVWLAKKCGVDDAVVLIDKLTSYLQSSSTSGD